MRRYIDLVTAFFFLIVLVGKASAASGDPNVMNVVRRIDELYRSKSSYAELEMEIITPHWQRTLRMKVWSKGMEKTFIRILSPKKEQGVGTLRIGDEMWNYLPKTNKVIKIPPSMMMSAWMGSDFTNDDLVKEYTFLEDFHFNLFTPQDAEGNLLYIECRPKEGRAIVWDKVNIAVRTADYIPIWQKYYDEKGKVMRVMHFRDIQAFGKRQIPAVLEMVPQNKEGHKTVIRYLDIVFDQEIAEDVFSLRNLRKGI
jgi:outer membrane lipoprotein-sorting protein